MERNDTYTFAMLGFGLVGIIAILAWMGSMTQDKDNGPEIRKNLGIMGGVSFAVILFFGFAAYNYFSVHVNYLTPFLFVMSFVNIFLSLFAVSAATLKIVKV